MAWNEIIRRDRRAADRNGRADAQTQDVGSASGNRGPSAYSYRILLSHALEHSILHAPDSQQSFPAFIVAGRKRQATCSDVAWFRGNHLAAVNLYGRHLRIYRLHEDNGTPTRLELLHEKGDVAAPEGVAVSHHGSILAVSHSLSDEFGVTLQTINDSSFVPGPAEILCKGRAGCAFHGVNFSPDDRHIAYTVIGPAPAIEVVKLDNREMSCRIGNFSPPLTPKSIAFSADGRFVLVVHGLIAAPTDLGNAHGGMLTVHRFDAQAGSVEVDPVAEYRAPGSALGFVDMSTFLPAKNGETYRILVADQGADVISTFSFNAAGGTLLPDGVFAENLSFPHGIDVSADGRYVAITTYGDDTIHIARGASVYDTKARLGLETIGVVAGKSHVAIIGHNASGYLGGAERSLLEILAAIDRDKYYVTCILPNGDDVYLQSVAKCVDDIIIFPYKWRATVPCQPETVSRFETIFRDNRVDLVHVNTIALVAPLMAALRLNVPTIVHARELIDQDEELARVLGSDPQRIEHTIKALSDFIIANSNATHRLFWKHDKSFRLYNCVDLSRFDLPNVLETGKLKVGIISNNQPKKGIEDFVKLAIAAGTCRPELEFFVIGQRTEHSDELKGVAGRQSQPVNIHFLGYIADPFDAVQLVNVVVSFSIVAESFGRTISEAMAMRRPVIAYNWGAAPELVRHAQDGFLIPYRNFEAALKHLGALADCPDQVLEMGQNGRARAEQLFSSKTFAVELNGIYRHVLEVCKLVTECDRSAA